MKALPGLFLSLTLAFGSGTAGEAELLFTIGVHVEPLGVTAQGYRGGRGDYANPRLFAAHVEYLYGLAEVAERHGCLLVIQVQSPFTAVAQSVGATVLADLATRGHEIGLHFHEDAHLGADSERLPPETWCQAMTEELELILQAGVTSPVRYWSGGNLYPMVLEAASCADLDVYSDWKDPRRQASHELVIGVVPWRPAGGPDPDHMAIFATHDPAGPVIYLPTGMIDPQAFRLKRRIIAEEGARGWFSVLGEDLLRSLEAARPGLVNVHHFTVHPGEFPLDLIDEFLTTTVDPLVERGLVVWATFSQMADRFREWEEAHPGVDPRSLGGF
jgi:hypothetical protein